MYERDGPRNLGFDEDAINRFFDEADGAYAISTFEDVRGTMQLEAAEAAILHAPGTVEVSWLARGLLQPECEAALRGGSSV